MQREAPGLLQEGGVETMWLLCDYGEVLCLDQPDEDVTAMAAASGCEEKTFIERYWKYRPDYDRAHVSHAQYWELVTETPNDPARLQTLVQLDVRSWTHLSAPALGAVARAAERGYQLAILSNAPVEVANAVESLPQLAAFKPKIFSCWLRANKPDAAVYERTLEALSAPPEDVVFFDDRATNVEAARRLGIQAHLFTDASQIDGLPKLS